MIPNRSPDLSPSQACIRPRHQGMIFRRFCQSPTFERFEHAGLRRKPVKGTWAQQKDACHVFSGSAIFGPLSALSTAPSPSLRCVPPRFMRSYHDPLFLAENVVSLMTKGKSFGAARNIRVKLVECVDNSLHVTGGQPTTTATQQLLYLSCLFLRSQSSCILMAGRVMTKLHKCLFAFLLVPAIYDADQNGTFVGSL